MSDNDDDALELLEQFEQSQGQQQADAAGNNKRKLEAEAIYVSAPMCSCGAGQCVIEREPNGREYFACPDEEDCRCSFKLYCDSQKQGRTAAAAAAAPTHAAPGGFANDHYSSPAGDTPAFNNQQQYGQQQQQYGQQPQQPYGQQQQPQGGQQWGGSGAYGGQPELPTPNCQCGEPAAFRTSNSAKNPGRQFYGCAKPMADETRCRYFKWADELQAAAAGGPGGQQQRTPGGGWGGGGGYGGGPQQQHTPAATAGGGGYGSQAGGGDGSEVLCVCGAPAITRTSNSVRNPGRKFYKCPKPQGEQCDWFKWADDAPPGAAGSSQPGSQAAAGGGYGFGPSTGYAAASGAAAGGALNGLNAAGAYNAGAAAGGGDGAPVGSARFAWEDAGPQPASQQGPAGGGGGGGGVCYKCNQPGHWARDCPNPGAAGGGGGVCYKCNQPGHWARDCPNASAGGGGYGGGGSSYGGGGGGGVCYKCNQPGHWARDCPNQQGGGGGRYGSGGGAGRGGGGRGGGVCYKCNQPGHWASSCPNS